MTGVVHISALLLSQAVSVPCRKLFVFNHLNPANADLFMHACIITFAVCFLVPLMPEPHCFVFFYCSWHKIAPTRS